MMIALMIKRNNPKVRKVSGMVMMINSGFRVAFNIPSKMATAMAVLKELMVTPGSNQSATKTAKELTTSLVSKPGF